MVVYMLVIWSVNQSLLEKYGGLPKLLRKFYPSQSFPPKNTPKKDTSKTSRRATPSSPLNNPNNSKEVTSRISKTSSSSNSIVEPTERKERGKGGGEETVKPKVRGNQIKPTSSVRWNWKDENERRRFFQSRRLSDRLNIQKPEDWYRVSREDMETLEALPMIKKYYKGSLHR